MLGKMLARLADWEESCREDEGRAFCSCDGGALHGFAVRATVWMSASSNQVLGNLSLLRQTNVILDQHSSLDPNHSSSATKLMSRPRTSHS